MFPFHEIVFLEALFKISVVSTGFKGLESYGNW